MESDSSDAERLPDLESLDDFLASSFDVDDEDGVEGSQENADSLGLEPYHLKPFVEGAEDEDSDSESPSDWDFGLFTLFCTDSFRGFAREKRKHGTKDPTIELCLPAMLAKDCTALYTGPYPRGGVGPVGRPPPPAPQRSTFSGC